jgi:hypothetical protein
MSKVPITDRLNEPIWVVAGNKVHGPLALAHVGETYPELTFVA